MKFKNKVVFGFLLLFVVLLIVLFPKLKRLNQVNHLFDEENILQNFQKIESIVEVSELRPAKQALKIASKNSYQFPNQFSFGSLNINTQDFLDSTRTEGLIVIQNDTIIFEEYFLGLEPSESHISWSVAKSFISTLAGITIDQGLLDINLTVDQYLPEFKDTGYEGVIVKDIMQMSSGVLFNEDYGDFNSDINRFGRTFALGSSFSSFAKSLQREKKPGTFNHYVSIDTQVLGMIISKIQKMSLTEMCQKHLWDSMGMEHKGSWIIDNENMEMALGGLNASLRDYAKLGLLYLHGGVLNGNRILSAEYIKQATTPDAPHLMPNNIKSSDNHFGYGYQWWIPQFPQGDFFAAGIYYQFIYVNPLRNLVIAKLSADHNFNKHRHLVKDQHIALFQTIARQL